MAIISPLSQRPMLQQTCLYPCEAWQCRQEESRDSYTKGNAQKTHTNKRAKNQKCCSTMNHECHPFPCMEFMMVHACSSCMMITIYIYIYHECNVGLSVIQPTCMQNQAVKGSQKVSITRHPIEQVFFCARLRNFAPVSRNFAPVSRDHCCTLFSFSRTKVASLQHPGTPRHDVSNYRQTIEL